MLSENHQHLSNLSRNGSGSSGETWNFHLSRNFPRKCSTHLMLLSTETWLWQIGKSPLLRSLWKGNRHQPKCSPAIQVSCCPQVPNNVASCSSLNIKWKFDFLCNGAASQDICCFCVKLISCRKWRYILQWMETEYLCQVRPVTSNSSGAVQWSGFDITTIGSQSQV